MFPAMPSASPPYDRAIILACTLRTVRTRFMEVRCRCGHATVHPVRKMLIDHPEWASRTLADTLVYLTCGGCRHRDRLTIHLCENMYGVGESLPKSVAIGMGWSLLLHGSVSQPPDPSRAMAAE